MQHTITAKCKPRVEEEAIQVLSKVETLRSVRQKDKAEELLKSKGLHRVHVS
jgi:hypothetical protein